MRDILLVVIAGGVLLLLFWLWVRPKERSSGAMGLNDGASPSFSGDGDPSSLESIPALLQRGNKIEAIKVYRLHHKVGLKEAKDAVDQMELELKGQPPR